METSRQIEQRAAAWLAQRDVGQWNENHDAHLQAWLQTSTEHYIAFIRLEHVWEEARRLKALDTGPAGTVPPPGHWQLSPFVEQNTAPKGQAWFSRGKPLALAASVVLVVGAAVLLASGFLRGDRYSTPVGGVASLPIADGSKITLNTDSRIRVVLSDAERLVRLEHGEAFFDVAKDPDRPFIVRAGQQRIMVVGTQFSVRREGDDLRVIVTEGMVQMGGTPLPAGSLASRVGGETRIERQPLARLEDHLSWRSGFLVFQEAELAEAVSEVNRYNSRQLVIRDPAVAHLRFSGKFRPTNVDAFVRLLETGFGVQAESRGARLFLSAHKENSSDL